MHRDERIANYVLISLFLAALALLSSPMAEPIMAIKTSLAYILDPTLYEGARGAERLAEAPSRLKELLQADRENQSLREEIRKAAAVQAEAEALKLENARLRSALSLKPSANFPFLLWASVVERDPLHRYRTVVIAAGARQGVAVNSPVLAKEGETVAAVGRVVEVWPDVSSVLLVTDELSSIAAYVVSRSTEGSPEGHDGLLQGQGRSRLRVNYLSPDAQLNEGDLVLSSPISATFPSNILIGTLSHAYPPDLFLTFKSAEVAPAVDVSSLREVMVLKARPQAQPAFLPASDSPEGGEPEASPAGGS